MATPSNTTCPECLENEADRLLDTEEENPATNWWHCANCDRHMDRYRGQGDQNCDCGAEYNAFGQKLRSNWRDNPSVYDEDVDDITGFELASLTRE